MGFTFDALVDQVREMNRRLAVLERRLSVGLPIAWQPQLFAATTAPTMGTGASLTGHYFRVGQTVIAWFDITFGTVMAQGTGTYFVRVPWPLESPNTSTGGTIGMWRGVVAPGSNVVEGMMAVQTADKQNLFMGYVTGAPGTAGSAAGPGTPMTWVAGSNFGGVIIARVQAGY